MWMRLFLVLYALYVGTLVFFRRLLSGPKRPGWSFTFESGVEIVRRLVRRGAVLLESGQGLRPIPGMPVPQSARVRTERTELAGLRTEVHTPAGFTNDHPTILYLHGGGYVSCSPGTHRELTRRLAIAAEARCVVPDYRKAPAHVFPAAVDDAVACYRALLAQGVPPQKLFVGGDSAGGGLTLALLQRLRDAGEPLPRAALLLSPWVDLACTGETLHKHAEYDYLSADMIVQAAKLYARDEALTHPHISPIHADLAGLPPLMVQTGGAEVFVSENLALVERARAAGVEVTHEIADDMVHVFQAFVMVSRPGHDAIQSLGKFVRGKVGVVTEGAAAVEPAAETQPAQPDAAV